MHVPARITASSIKKTSLEYLDLNNSGNDAKQYKWDPNQQIA